MLGYLRSGNKRTKAIFWALTVLTVLSFVGGFIFLAGVGRDPATRARMTGNVGSINGQGVTRTQWQTALDEARQNYRQRYGSDPQDRDIKAVEQQAWRWTGRQFIAVLAPPADPAGRALSISFTAAESVFRGHPSITVKCAVDGIGLAPETFTAPGPYVMTRPIGQPLSSRAAQVQVYCEVDHVTRVEGDQRELGIIVTRLGLI